MTIEQTPDRWPGYTAEAQAYEESTRPIGLTVLVDSFAPDPQRTAYPSSVALGIGRDEDGRLIEFAADVRVIGDLVDRYFTTREPVPCVVQPWQIIRIAGVAR